MPINKNYIYIAVAVLGVGVILVLLYFAFQKPSSNIDKPFTGITVTGKDNQLVEVNNFYENPVEESPGAITINRTTDLATYFFNEDGSKFTITLNEGTFEEFQAKRTKAEQEFLQILGITAEEACNLNVWVLNGGSFDPELQGKVFPLSFCTN